jgi:hypothetical protein
MREALARLGKLSSAGLVGYPSLFPSWTHTSVSRSASGFACVYWMMLPLGIHGLMMQNGSDGSEILMTGSKFGCEMDMRPSFPRRKNWYEMY